MTFKVKDAHWEVLAEAMEENSVIATGKFVGPNGKAYYKKLWTQTANKLNSLGLGSRTTEKWQKTWTDYKYNLKKKAAGIKKNMKQTGGGPPDDHNLSEIELKFLDIMGEHFTGLDTQEYGLPISGNDMPLENNDNMPECSFSNEVSPEVPFSKNVLNVPNTKKQILQSLCEEVPEKRRKMDYNSEYKDTINELREIKTVLKDISKTLGGMLTVFGDLNKNIENILDRQANQYIVEMQD